MSLVIFVSPKTVIISKYQLEFAFQPPARNLTQAALGAYQLLRQSESIQIESTRDERQEAITLLRNYGQELFQAVVPASHQSKIHQAGGVFIFTMDPPVSQLPWELLYDGSSFFSLTQGIVRINRSNAYIVPEQNGKPLSSLRIALSSFAPIPPPAPGNRFINYIEALPTGPFSELPFVDFQIDSNASESSLLESLERAPNLFLFSGHETEAGWLLDGAPAGEGWFKQTLAPALMDAVSRGLRILVLVTSQLLQKEEERNPIDPLKRYFDLGVPYIISVNGRVARHRFQEYFQNFVMGLLREENILRAHRHAINSIYTSLPLSWDWSWIQLHLNQKTLEQKSETPLPPFRFRSEDGERPSPRKRPFAVINSRRFYGSSSVLQQLSSHLLSSQRPEVLNLRTTLGCALEDYIQEFIRRLIPQSAFQLSVLYYQRWGYRRNQQERLTATPVGNLFPFYFGHQNVGAYFDRYLISLPATAVSSAPLKFLVVFYPPERHDASFDHWLSEKQEDGWRIVLLSNDAVKTEMSSVTISADMISAAEISDAFEDDLPEPWIDLVKDPLPEPFQNLSLLKMAQHSGNETVIQLFLKKQQIPKLWKKTLHAVLPTLSSQRFRIFLALYLLRVTCSRELLEKLLGIRKIEADLSFLQRLHLINANLPETHFWIPVNLCLIIEENALISKNQLLGFGRELLQRQTALLQGPKLPPISRICGFQYCINTLAEFGQIENPLQRNLQFGRKLSRLPGIQPALFYPNICTSVEMVLASGEKQDVQKTVVSVLEMIEHLPLEKHAIRIYQWLIKSEEKGRNWALVAELQMKLASVYTRLNMREKAIGLITSAIQLNDDIKNYTHRYTNLITISLLLLDLGEFEKVRKIINHTEFDPAKLSEGEIARLWLIDGHLLFNSGKTKEAAASLRKSFKKAQAQIPGGLMAKTHVCLAEYYRTTNDRERYLKHLHQAALHFERAGSRLQAAELHEQLLDIYLSSDRNSEAAQHLEWLYMQVENAGDKERRREIADQLGGLYYKIGDKEKSTHYYSIAQGI